MSFDTVCFIAFALAAAPQSAPAIPSAAELVGAERVIVTAEPAQEQAPARSAVDRPHRFGLGATMTASNRGAGGAMRYWFGEYVGVDFSAQWYRPRYTVASGSRGSTFQAIPSVVILLKKPNLTRDVDLRPYVGGGLNYVRSTRPLANPSQTAAARSSGVGGQVFGGVEMTFREAPQVTISGEAVYYKLPINYVGASMIGGMNYIMAVHFYLK